MGRYTTVQTFADNNPSVAKVDYDQAALASSKIADEKRGDFGAGVSVEKVNNVMGSTAGAGSGDFHHYRHCRRREMERLESMEKRSKEEEANLEFEKRVEAKRKECEERTRKNAEKRRRKRMKNNEAKGDGRNASSDFKEGRSTGNGGNESPVDESEFSYTPVNLSNGDANNKKMNHDDLAGAASGEVTEAEVLKSVVTNDGSFMEKTKALLGSETSANVST